MRSIKLPSWTERLLGIDAQPVPPHVFGLDERSLRYCAFRRDGAVADLVELGSFEIADNGFFEGPLGGPLRDADRFGEQLESLLSETSERPREASLVLPDRWLRLVFAEIGELPDASGARLEALRFKLRRLVPFRVEDLRIEGVEVRPLPGQTEARRVVLSFAAQNLLDQIETLFEAAGVRLGLIANRSVCLMSTLPSAETVALLRAGERGYSLLIHHRDEPVLYRYKPLSGDLDPTLLGSIVGRDLQLTRTFLEEKIGGEAGREIWLASNDLEPWSSWIEAGVGVAPRPLSAATLPALGALPAELPVFDGGPLVGAVLQEIA